jgi:hypothetical protein
VRSAAVAAPNAFQGGGVGVAPRLSHNWVYQRKFRFSSFFMLADFGVSNLGKHHLRIRGARPVPSSGAHRQDALASLPESRKLSGPHPVAMPLRGFAHSRAENNQNKKG